MKQYYINYVGSSTYSIDSSANPLLPKGTLDDVLKSINIHDNPVSAPLISRDNAMSVERQIASVKEYIDDGAGSDDSLRKLIEWLQFYK